MSYIAYIEIKGGFALEEQKWAVRFAKRKAPHHKVEPKPNRQDITPSVVNGLSYEILVNGENTTGVLYIRQNHPESTLTLVEPGKDPRVIRPDNLQKFVDQDHSVYLLKHRNKLPDGSMANERIYGVLLYVNDSDQGQNPALNTTPSVA